MTKSYISHFKSLSSGKEEFDSRISVINNSKKFLYISVYFCQLDKYGEVFFESLISALKRGVRVYLIIDSFGQKLSKSLMGEGEWEKLNDVYKRIEGCGGSIIWYKAPSKFRHFLGSGYHIKIQLNDQGEAIYGSSNISATSFEKWQEYSAYLQGKIVNVLLEDLEYLLPTKVGLDVKHLNSVCSNKKPQFECEYVSCDPNIGSKLFGNTKNNLTNYLCNFINKAENSINISSFYFKPCRQLLSAIISASKRGVEINIYHSSKDALSTNIAWLPCFKNYELLLKNGVNIFEREKGEHSKIIVIDNRIGVFGSYNFEQAAHHRLAESMISTKEKKVVEELTLYFENFSKLPYKKVELTDVNNTPVGIGLQSLLLTPLERFI